MNKYLAIAFVALALVKANPSFAQPEATQTVAPPRPDGKVAMFYDALAPYGNWFWHDRYGWVWSPRDVAYGWRPYTDGHWLYSDLGWTWYSDLAWGWAPFHYGRWSYETTIGWFWVPDTEWAPAWVAWQEGDPWAGWAPLPPLVDWQVATAWDSVISPFCWSFVEIEFLPAHHLHRHIVPAARNVTLIRETRNVTRFVFNGQRQIVSSGIDPVRVERATGHALPRLRVENVTTVDARPGLTIDRDRLLVVRPDLIRARQPGANLIPVRPVPALIPTPPGPVLSRDFLQRQEAERRRLAEEQAAEAARLEESHRRELRNPPPGLALPNLAERHLNEHRAFNEQVMRQNQLFEHRAQQSLQSGSRPAQGAGRVSRH
jgi:hypothetical protein